MPEGGGSIAEETEAAMFLAGMPKPDGREVSVRNTRKRRTAATRSMAGILLYAADTGGHGNGSAISTHRSIRCVSSA